MGYVNDKLSGCPETVGDIRTVYLLKIHHFATKAVATTKYLCYYLPRENKCSCATNTLEDKA